MMELYKYSPIVAPDNIRMLQLLPSSPDEHICIRLSHHPLSDLPQCEALSYEWGSKCRRHKVLCGGKAIKVTGNLINALKRLRNDPSHSGHLQGPNFSQQSRLLWVDAICINQDDLEERGSQVRLMHHIYPQAQRVVIWLGEVRGQIEAASPWVSKLAKVYYSFNVDETQSYYHNRRLDSDGTVMLDNNLTLAKLPSLKVWPYLLNYLCCTFFERLWTVQEVALASRENAIILRGRHCHRFTEFQAAATLIYMHDDLYPYCDSRARYLLESSCERDLLRGSGHGLPECAQITRYQKKKDPRDTVFALLGITTTSARSALSGLDYTNTTGEVFKAAREHIISNREYRSLPFVRHRGPRIDLGLLDEWDKLAGKSTASYRRKSRRKGVGSGRNSKKRVKKRTREVNTA